MVAISIPLFVIRHRLIGGTESSLYNICRGLQASGAALTVARSRMAFSDEFEAWMRDAGVEQQLWPAFGTSGVARFAAESWYAASGRAARNVLLPNYFLPPVRHRSSRYAVLTHDLQFKTFPQFFTAKKRRWLEANHRYAFPRADALLFISEFERDQAARHYGEGLLRRSHVVYNPVDWSRYDGVPSAATAALAARRFVLAIAHPFPHKNLHTLAAAFSRLAATDDDLALVLVGQKSDETQRLVRAAVDEALLPRVHFTGFLPDADVGALYRGASLVAVPSLYEGFGMPAVEGLGFGKPVLATDAGALREVTLDRARYLPKTAGPADWADAMAAILRGDPHDWRGAAEAVRARYDPVAIAGRIERAFA